MRKRSIFRSSVVLTRVAARHQPIPDPVRGELGFILLLDLGAEFIAPFPVVLDGVGISQVETDRRVNVLQCRRGVLLSDLFGGCAGFECTNQRVQRAARFPDEKRAIVIAGQWRTSGFDGKCFRHVKA